MGKRSRILLRLRLRKSRLKRSRLRRSKLMKSMQMRPSQTKTRQKAMRRSRSTSRPKSWGSALYVLRSVTMPGKLLSSSMRRLSLGSKRTRTRKVLSMERARRPLPIRTMLSFCRVHQPWQTYWKVVIDCMWCQPSSESREMPTCAWRPWSSSVRWPDRTSTSVASPWVRTPALSTQRSNSRSSSLSLVKWQASNWWQVRGLPRVKTQRRSKLPSPTSCSAMGSCASRVLKALRKPE